MAHPVAPNLKKLLQDGKTPDRASSLSQQDLPVLEQRPSVETFLAEWAAAEFLPENCLPLDKEHPLAYARSRMLDLARALRAAGYVS
jgi:hypothetical protein